MTRAPMLVPDGDTLVKLWTGGLMIAICVAFALMGIWEAMQSGGARRTPTPSRGKWNT